MMHRKSFVKERESRLSFYDTSEKKAGKKLEKTQNDERITF